MRIAIYTLGCKINQVESWSLADAFENRGFEIVGHRSEADIYLINTCSVTARAAYQSRQAARRFLREHPGARIIATGCHAQADPADMLDISDPPVCVAGNDSKHLLPDIVNNLIRQKKTERECLGMFVGDISAQKDIKLCSLEKPRSRTRGFLKIQDGCNSFCSYCIVPYTRGRSRSLPVEQVIRQVERYSENNIREIVVTGIHAGLYGADLNPATSLFSLLKKLCSSFPHIRFRLSSIEPTEISSEMIEWAAETGNFCRHWHIPLQSGSDRILSCMNRRYDSSLFIEKAREIKAVMPDASIGADVMAGFPSEGHDDFSRTVKVIEESGITYIHAFPYSIRNGTLAASMTGQIGKDEKKRRAGILRKAAEKKKHEFYTGRKGKLHFCLAERRDIKSGHWKGFTENYLPVMITGAPPGNLENTIVPVIITGVRDNTCIGKYHSPTACSIS